MIDIGVYEDFLKVLETHISEHRIRVDKMMIDAKTQEEKSQVEKLRVMTLELEEALRNKDTDTLNKIISNASNSNR